MIPLDTPVIPGSQMRSRVVNKVGDRPVPHYLCSSEAVQERSTGFPFKVSRGGRLWPGFAIRFEGQVKAYLNVCAHVGLSLEGGSGQFFSRDSQHLICTHHGATYEPDNGLCVKGPCAGLSLIKLNLVEKHDAIYLDDKEYVYND